MNDPIALLFTVVIWAVLWTVLIHKMGFRGKYKIALIVTMCIPIVCAVTLLMLIFVPWPNNQRLKAAAKELDEHRKTAALKSTLDSELRRLQNGE